ncbi:MAG: hypothetical protein EOO14_03530 [Chitinophagaceae bacterium]|nr:MAG: hypothetical protein EOO14_03530 [Chitinophagaceae bacterium]
MLKNIAFGLLAIITLQTLSAQPVIPAGDVKLLQKKEDSLKILARTFLTAEATEERMRKDSLFVKTLIRTLQVKNSFYYPFDSLRGISKLYAPDSTFRIFTWQLDFQDSYAVTRQRGAIQFRTQDGSLNLVPLRDYSEFADDPMDSARSRNTWIGAVYYNIIQNEHNGKKYYTLFGFDGNSYRTNKKWIDVLTFDNRNQPVFGGRQFFTFEKDTTRRNPQHRFGIEYKKDASTMLNYDDDLKLILVDHLISETDEPEYPWTFVPDGDYEGFQWVDGRWQHIDKVFDFKLKDGEAPVPDALKDLEGKSDEFKLSEQSRKNMGEKAPQVPPAAKPATKPPATKKPVKKG